MNHTQAAKKMREIAKEENPGKVWSQTTTIWDDGTWQIELFHGYNEGEVIRRLVYYHKKGGKLERYTRIAPQDKFRCDDMVSADFV